MRVVIINGTRNHTEQLTSLCRALLGDVALVNLGLLPACGDTLDQSGASETPLGLVIEAQDQVNDAFRLLDQLRGQRDFERFVRLLAVEPVALDHLHTIGAFDDFMLAPYTGPELRRRLQAAWARRRSERITFGETYRLTPELTVDAIGHHVLLGDKSIELTAKEHALLVCFCRSLGRVQSRAELISRVWGSGYAGSLRTIDIHVRRLRFKLGDALPLYTIRGTGYWLKVGPMAEPSLKEVEHRALLAEPGARAEAASTAA